MKRLLVVASLAVAALGLVAGPASARLFCRLCCKKSWFCVKPYNAFSPVACGTITPDCFPGCYPGIHFGGDPVQHHGLFGHHHGHHGHLGHQGQFGYHAGQPMFGPMADCAPDGSGYMAGPGFPYDCFQGCYPRCSQNGKGHEKKGLFGRHNKSKSDCDSDCPQDCPECKECKEKEKKGLFRRHDKSKSDCNNGCGQTYGGYGGYGGQGRHGMHGMYGMPGMNGMYGMYNMYGMPAMMDPQAPIIVMEPSQPAQPATPAAPAKPAAPAAPTLPAQTPTGPSTSLYTPGGQVQPAAMFNPYSYYTPRPMAVPAYWLPQGN
jgi:hypothetical protein